MFDKKSVDLEHPVYAYLQSDWKNFINKRFNFSTST